MTTPVLFEQKMKNASDPSKEWVMSFILPQNYVLSNAPAPANNNITLHEYPVHLVASISYPGLNNIEKIEEYTAVLKKWLKKRPWYIPMSAFQTAQFDGPLTIPFFRKNEIHVEVKHLH